MEWIAELERLMPPPAAEIRGIVPAEADWRAAEKELGVAVPPDYKAFIATWGGDGKIADHFLFYVPGSKSDYLRLPEATKRAVWSYDEMRKGHPRAFPLPAFPAEGSFFPIGVTDNGDYFGWIIGAGAPETWKVAWLGDEEGEPDVYDLTFGPWLVELVQGNIDGKAMWIPPGDELPMAFAPLGSD